MSSVFSALNFHVPDQNTFPPAAELRGVTKRFGPALALENLSLAAQPGEFLTLLGPSGCGKTTALRLLSGFEQPDVGTVLLAGRDVTALPPYEREVNQVFQSYALFPHLSVRDNVAFGLRMKCLPAAEIARRVGEVVELVALDGLLERRPAELSGGQRQRVALARALVCEPKVLLLDEPLSALDARLRAQVRGELRALQRRLGLTFVFVTHDQEEALTLSDRVAVMNAGRVEQIGSPEDIYHRPTSRFVAGFVGEANLLEAEVVGQEGNWWVCRVTTGGGMAWRVHAAAENGPTCVVGQGGALLIRPEYLRVAAPETGAGAVNLFHVTEVERTFQGAATMITWRIEGANPSMTLRSWHGGTPPLAAGSVTLTVDPADVRVLVI